jgi:ABC-type Fe3+/spermidine/putrescine transport system ATPase subunit
MEGKVVDALPNAVFLVELANGQRLFAAQRKTNWKPGDNAHLLVRPESIRLTGEPTGAENEIAATIEKVSFTGSVVNYFILVDGIAESYRVQNLPPVKYREGDRVYANFFGAECNLTKE